MKRDCHYHPGDPAKWHCADCQLHYCSGCMPDADVARQRGICPHCSRPMKYLGAASEVQPFWTRLPAFFRYPLHKDPMAVILICTLVPLFLAPNLFGFVVSFVLLLALFKYTYAVIRRTAEGHMTPPPLAEAFTGTGFGIVLKQVAVFVAMVVAVVFTTMTFGNLAGMLVMAFAVLALPASIMVLAMEQSVRAAVNPLNLATLIARIGRHYFLLYLFLILLTIASSEAQSFAWAHLDPLLANPLAGFLNSTYTLILFHMLGYLLFEYQEELGFASDLKDDTEAADTTPADRSRRVDADIDMNLKDGRYDRVSAILEETLKRDPDNPVRLGQLYRLCEARNDTKTLARHHIKLMRWMTQARRPNELKTLFQTLEQADPDFGIQDPELLLACADAFYHQQSFQRVLKLLRDFHKRFPGTPQTGPAYLLVARTLANGYNQWDKAISYLKFVLKTDPAEPVQTLGKLYLEQAQQRAPLKEPKASFAPAGEAREARSL